MFGPSGVSIGQMRPLVRRMNVADFESSAFAREAPWSESRETPLVSDFAQRVGLVHELLSCELPKNSRIAAITGLAFTKSCGMAVDISWYTLIFSLMARSMRTSRCGTGSPAIRRRRDATVSEMVDVVHHADVFAQLEQVLDGRDEVRCLQRAIVQRRIQPHLDVEFQAADAAEIVFARIKNIPRKRL